MTKSNVSPLKIIENAYSKAIIRTIPDMFFLLDTTFVIKDYKVNDESALYVQPSQFINKKVSEVLPEDVAKAFETTGMEALKKIRWKSLTMVLITQMAFIILNVALAE